MTKFAYRGIEAIKEAGLNTWRQDYHEPLTAPKFQSLCNKLLDAYAGLVSSGINAHSKDVLYILWKIVFKYSNALNRHISGRILERDGYRQISKESNEFYKFNPHILNSIRRNRPLSRLKRDLSNWTRRTVFFRRGRFLSLGPESSLKVGYARHNRGVLLLPSLPEIFKDRQTKNADPLKEDAAFIKESLLDCGTDILQEFLGGIENKDKEFILTATEELSADFRLAYRIYRDALACRILSGVKELYAEGLGNIFMRIVMKAAQQRSVKVTGFNHGNSMPAYYSRPLFLNELTTVDNYVTDSPIAQRFFKRLIERPGYPPLPSKPVVSCLNRRVPPRPAADGKKRCGSRRVMFVEFPLDPFRYMYNGALYYTIQLDLALRVMEFLKRRSYYVIIKLHPDRLKESEAGKIYKGFCDEAVAGRFEEKNKLADTIIFGHLFTTAFGSALDTDKKIIYFSYGRDEADEETALILDKRCYALNSGFDERGRITFDPDELLQCLESTDYKLQAIA